MYRYFVLIFPFFLIFGIIKVIPIKEIHQLKTEYINVVFNETVHYEISPKTSNSYVRLSEISPELKNAILLSEDWSFYHHKGIDFDQVKEALKSTFFQGKKLRGASTISQQLVKNLFLSHERTFLRKFKELFITLYMEQVLSKNKILELYLNIVEFGPGIYGVKDASDFYFEMTALNLPPRESSFLAMLLPNPTDYSFSFRQKELSDYAFTMIKSILHKLKVQKVISTLEYQAEIDRPFIWEKSYDAVRF